MIIEAIKYYRRQLNLSEDDIISRESGLQVHHQHYLNAKKAYSNGQWLQSAESMELAISDFKNSVNECLLLCEDIIFINMTTTGFDEKMLKNLEDYNLIPNFVDYYNILRAFLTYYLKCCIDCHDRMSTVNGKYHEKYLSSHFHYLQFDYFKCKLK